MSGQPPIGLIVGHAPARPSSGPASPTRMFVIDTSVAMKWYVPEAGRPEALLYMAHGIERHAPDLLPLEGAHALLKRTRSADPVLRLWVVDVLIVAEALRDSSPILYHACGPLLVSALGLAIEIGASVYDGLFLALASLLDCSVVTADRKFLQKIRSSPHHPRVRWFMDPP